MDRSPLFETDWYDPKQYHFVKHTSHVYKGGHYVKTQQPRRVNYTREQPEYTRKHNCTAAIIDANLVNYPWVTIPCDEQFYASYFCQPLHSRRKIVRKVGRTNVTCNGNWLLLKGSETCVLVLETNETELTFDDSQYMCSLHNASVLSVKVSDQIASEKIKKLKLHLLYDSNHKLSSRSLTMIQKMTSVNILTIMFGRQLDRNSPKSILPYMIYHANSVGYEEPYNMSFFVDFSNTCSIADFLMKKYRYADMSYPTNEWGVKCRYCSEKIKVAGVICEKHTDIYISGCQNNHFKCLDKTCILDIYKCDYIADCLDNSDEDNCVHNTLIDQFVNVPCSPTGDCDVSKGNLVRVHDICNGIYHNYTLPHEINVCITFNHNIFMPLAKTHTSHTEFKLQSDSEEMAELFKTEMKYNCSKLNDQFAAKNKNINSYERRLANINTNLGQICIFNARKQGRNIRHRERICEYISCPGMFKCYDELCIPLSLVCDNTYDCKLGEDESMCSTLTCPGSLKCRRENRCISTHEICDKLVNCLYTMDDELGCATCPANCDCRGYVMICYSNKSNHIIEIEEVLYSKGLLIKGIQHVLFTDDLHFIGLIFLNISHCGLREIYISHTLMVSFIITDFSHNQLSDTKFINSQIFNSVVFLDLSFNLLQIFKVKHYSSLQYLTILYLTGNNLNEIGITTGKGHLALIDLQFISYHPTLVINTYPNFDIVAKVTDSQFCCIFLKHIRCLSNQTHMKCYGLLEKLITKIVLYCLSIFALCLAISALVKQAIQITSNNKTQRSSHYVLLLLNQLISSILTSLYLVILTTVDIAQVNVLLFKTSALCFMLHGLIYISFETIIVFKCIMISLIMVKIIFPFKHQCTWVNYVVPASGFVWIFVATTFLIHICMSLQEQNKIIFDTLCSIGWCDMNIKFNVFYSMIYIVDYLSFFFYIVTFSVIYNSLNKYHNEVTFAGNNRRNSAIVTTCKLILVNVSEIVLRLYFVALLSTKSAHSINANFCFYFFIWALPVNIIFFASIYIVR